SRAPATRSISPIAVMRSAPMATSARRRGRPVPSITSPPRKIHSVIRALATVVYAPLPSLLVAPQIAEPASDEDVRFRARSTRKAAPPRTHWKNRACSHPHSVALSARFCRRTLPPNRRRRTEQRALALLRPGEGELGEPGATRRLVPDRSRLAPAFRG